MKTTGTTTRDPAANYFPGSQSPENNWTWGLNRVPLEGPVAPGQQRTVAFTIKTSTKPRSYNFQWRMVQQRKEMFEEFTTNVGFLSGLAKRKGSEPIT